MVTEENRPDKVHIGRTELRYTIHDGGSLISRYLCIDRSFLLPRYDGRKRRIE
jgi:hypothetical protein